MALDRIPKCLNSISSVLGLPLAKLLNRGHRFSQLSFIQNSTQRNVKHTTTSYLHSKIVIYFIL